MKKLFLMLPFVCFLVFLSSFSITAYAETTDKSEYNIQIEILSDTQNAKELNKYRKNFLNYFNECAKKERKASGSNSYKLLKLDDLDFTDNSKVSGLKIHGSYTDYEYYAKYDEFMKSLENKDCWNLIITKGNTLYDVSIVKTDFPEKYGDNLYKVGGNWYIWHCQLYLEEYNWTVQLRKSADIVKSNIKNLLEYYNVDGTDIKVVFTDLNYWSTNCAVIFVDNTAQYIYAGNFSTPYFYNENPDVPQEIQNALSECASGLFRGSYEQETTEIKRFRDYNMVISLFRLYEYYSKNQ